MVEQESKNKAIRMGKGVRAIRGNQGNRKFQADDTWV